MEKVLHLFITNDCRHKCEFCCNKLYKIPEIPVATVELLKSVQTVCLTGGEPFSLFSDVLAAFIVDLRKQFRNIKNLYIYTSGKECSKNIEGVLHSIDSYAIITETRAKGVPPPPYFLDEEHLINGISFAPKDIDDWIGVKDVISRCPAIEDMQSNRLYVFKEQYPIFEALNLKIPKNFQIIDRQWTRSFNTPPNEYFARLPILMRRIL